MKKVNEEQFKSFTKWYNDNISSIRSKSVMVADRVNFFNNDNDLIAYISLYMEDEYFVRETYYNQMLIKD